MSYIIPQKRTDHPCNSNNSSTLCISNIPIQFTAAFIRQKIEEFSVGTIEHYSEVFVQHHVYKRVIINLKWNLNSDKAVKCKNWITSGKTLKLVVDKPWFWIASLPTLVL